MLNEINILKRFFESKSIHISTYWLECCLEWFKENNRTYNETLMCNEVLGQWLEADLRDIEYPSLPLNISSHKKHTLPGNYSVQLMYVKDISRSAYSQLKNIRDLYKLTRGEVDADTMTSGEGKRVLYLYITDGVQHINAFEYQQISCLNTNLPPGTKLLLVGPLLIRNGEILLKENNVRVLGGQVEDLLITNAYENVLARELNMPQNPTPGQIQISNDQFTNTNNVVPPTRNNNPLIYSNHVNSAEIPVNNDYLDDDDDIFNNINLSEHFDHFNDDLTHQENELFQDSIDINLEELEESEQRAIENTRNPVREIPVNDNIEPFVYIKYLLDNSDNVLNKTYKVKAQFLRVVEKLNVNKTKGWTMKFEIMDSTGTIVVDFLSSVIEKLMDISPNEAIAENLKVKNKISKSHEKVSEALKNCKKKLDSFEYIMHLQFNQIDRPTVICLETLTEEHFIQLKNRVERTQVKLL